MMMLLALGVAAIAGQAVATEFGAHCRRGSGGIESDIGAGPSVDSVLLQSRDRDSMSRARTPPHKHDFLPLCHSSIVTQTCGRLNGVSEDLNATMVTMALIADHLSASDEDMAALWTALGLPAGQEDFWCQELCEKAVRYVRSTSGAVLPPTSDMACYTVQGKTACDVDATPGRLVQKMALVEDAELPDGGYGPNMVAGVEGAVGSGAGPGLVQIVSATMGTGEGAEGSLGLLRRTSLSSRDALGEKQEAEEAADEGLGPACSYSIWEGVDRILGFFRVYPSRGRGIHLSLPTKETAFASSQDGSNPALLENLEGSSAVAPPEVEKRIAATNALAKAWVSTVLREMRGQKTAEFRQRWFGGSGSKTSESVRQRVGRTMNFIERELVDGLRYVYPANKASGSACRGNVVAYVWKGSGGRSGEYAETTFPMCRESDDPFEKRCAVDPRGRYFVYLCERWYRDMDDNFQIATLVHEAAHHSGPRDVDYNRAAMQKLKQAEQLNNAANYQNFAQDVAQSAWGCADSKEVTGTPYFCGNRQPCPCSALAKLCNDQRFGSTLRSQCRATCGLCKGPVQESTDCEDTDGNCDYYRKEGYCASSENVKTACKKSCGLCGGSGGPSQQPTCQDTDGNCAYYRSKGYCATENVKTNCRRTCGFCV